MFFSKVFVTFGIIVRTNIINSEFMKPVILFTIFFRYFRIPILARFLFQRSMASFAWFDVKLNYIPKLDLHFLVGCVGDESHTVLETHVIAYSNG